jgi:hypothetical protein
LQRDQWLRVQAITGLRQHPRAAIKALFVGVGHHDFKFARAATKPVETQSSVDCPISEYNELPAIGVAAPSPST